MNRAPVCNHLLDSQKVKTNPVTFQAETDGNGDYKTAAGYQSDSSSDGSWTRLFASVSSNTLLRILSS